MTVKFYDRDRELGELGKVEKQTGGSVRMTVITGRRRVENMADYLPKAT
jgi:hypothetical protein